MVWLRHDLKFTAGKAKLFLFASAREGTTIITDNAGMPTAGVSFKMIPETSKMIRMSIKAVVIGCEIL